MGCSTLVAVVPAAYLSVVSAVGLPRPARSIAPPRTYRTRFAVFVPAHNEAAGITATLESLRGLEYPRDLCRIHVVADNCTDDTARIVERSGVGEVHERTDPAHSGKGPALNWMYDRLVERGDDFDAVVVVDADTSVAPNLLSAMHDVLARGATAAQAYYSVREPDVSPAAAFRFAALACRHHLRALGRTRLGGSCGLYGNGMVFTDELLARRRWSGHLVEDAEFQNEILLDGHLVHYVPEAAVWAEMPATIGASTSQNERWERGRLETARRYVPHLARMALTTRRHRIAYADAVLDHLVPPLSVLVAVQSFSVAVAVPGTVRGARWARHALMLSLAALVATFGHVAAGLVSVNAPARVYRSLLGAPKIVLWKVGLWLRIARPGNVVTWNRTQRNAEVIG